MPQRVVSVSFAEGAPILELGVVSLLRAFASHFLAQTGRAYTEKRDTYLGFLKAWKARAERPEEYVHWRSQCELLGSAEVLWRIQGIEQAETFSYEDAANAYPLLIEAMRADLRKGPAEKWR